ncbi:MAG TPA: VOC family protein [Myxococcota bacterium]|nr:VOC family protein [Myxococcota bacterium]
MSSSHGNFVWYELMTTDHKAAEAFYHGVIGWRAQDAGMPDRSYTILSVAETPIGGLMELPREDCEAGARPGWIGYVSADDVDATAARVTQAGGAVHRTPEDIPGVGRFAIVSDPHGATFALFKGSTDAQGRQPAPNTPGHMGWHELHAGDRESAFTFYSRLFGWTKAESVDMGSMGIYQLFATGKEPVGSMMTKTEAVQAPFWLYYFNVDDIEAGAARVKDKGGKVLNGPHQVPGGSWIVQCLDPQGAMFALVGPHR